MIANEPVPPILNSARLEWVSLYLGREPFEGKRKLSEQWAEAEDFDGIDADVHLYKVREMYAEPQLQKLIDAYFHTGNQSISFSAQQAISFADR